MKTPRREAPRGRPDGLPPGKAWLPSRWSFALLGAVAVLWSVLAWFAVQQHFEARTAATLAQKTSEIQQSMATMRMNVERVIDRLEGVAAVLAGMDEVKRALAPFGAGARPSARPYEERKAEWTQRADLLALSRQLRTAAADIGVDIVWAMNAGGDCVAASNAGTPVSFVGTNYADRSYFSSALAGKRGHQFAVGRVTRVPGLFFSAPVIVDGRVLGAVAVKNDLPRIASAINHPHAFVTDEFGVIILAADRSLEMRALPAAAVHQLPAEQRLARYLRQEFETYGTGARSGPGALLRVRGSPHPHIAARADLPRHGIALHILTPVKELASLRGDARVAFALLAFSGITLAALVFGASVYLGRMHEHRRSMEAKNESLARLNAQLEGLATTDALTGLHNRRFMDEFLAIEVERARRKRTPLALILIDIDHFKAVNDDFGHAAGDAVLRATALMMKRLVRGSDVLCRYGGEEFLVAMPEASLEAARARAEALRRAMHELKIAHEGGVLRPITLSLGLAVWPQHGADADAVLSAADAALYQAKKSGRNRVGVAVEAEGPTPGEAPCST